ncbi:MAG: transcription-repair coupling factor [Xanthomonadales bacterium]|nr:transcription-repair coupling factor [Xanthomonadales bacterium]NNK50199.1 transcription-repair coupling factor [Xanthomonadales bacterium]
MAESPFSARFRDSIETWSGLHGSAVAIAIQAAASAHKGVTFIVTRSSHQAQVLARDLELLALGELPVQVFPDHETLPYDPFSPHPDIIAERLKTLSALSSLSNGIVLAPVTSLIQRLPPAGYILQRSFDLAAGQPLVISDFRTRLNHAGYESSEQVYQAGQYAIRGSVVDIFPAGSPGPYRLDLFDEEIDTIRAFDPESQRSTGKVESINLLPAREYPCDEEGLENFRRAFRMRFDVDTRNVTLYQDLRSGIHPQGLEQYLPLFYPETSFLFEYLRQDPRLIMQPGSLEAAHDHMRRTTERWEQRRHDIERPVLDPWELYFTPEHFEERLRSCDTTHLQDPDTKFRAKPAFTSSPAPDVHIHERGKEAAADLNAFLEAFNGRVLFAADTPGRRELLRTTLATFGVKPESFDDFAGFVRHTARLGLAVLPIDEGFMIPGELALITESQMFGGRTRPRLQRAASERDPESIIRNLTDLAAGAPVVHEDHGVGRYLGLEVLEIDQRPAEFLMLEYAGGDKLYVPVSSLHLISRYTGSEPESAPLHRLGSQQWEKARRKAARQVRDVAAELLDLYSRRLARQGFSFPLDQRLYAEFASGFPFEETTDQQNAIDAVISDLESAQPMDRVVCGDVGFGKTEVALRAAFVAVQAGRQVALLVPTTLLAQQHFSTFSDRLADWPVKVELLSRFRTGTEMKMVLNKLREGKADIVIGTHRLIQKDIRFKQLGLVIIDEEQRFGVRQKERLKQLRAEVDLLTLTATPIPRTLNMAMSGIRDLSIIATPPARRMAVKTLISEWDRSILREALSRELQRGGQVFFLHNEVRTIERIAREVQEMAPNARLAVAHGQMPERELEKVMLDFYRQRYNILVCTTIIESGIDVPTANTIVINRADRFGLAQLHQLRGRVGRSHHRAYAYLIVPEKRSMTADARKRLEAIASLEELGAGFTLATHDLEIRGAGELLGAEQSGQINQVGFSLYSDMLARAVEALRKGEEPELEDPVHRGIEIELHLPALIPESYLGDVQARLTLYKRVASARDSASLRELQVEMIDRFGLLPDEVKALFEIAELRLLAERIGIMKIDFGPQGGRVEFSEHARADPAALIGLIQERSADFRLDGPQKLRILLQDANEASRFSETRALLERLDSNK